MLTARQPAVAGMFYPEDPTELHNMVTSLLAHAPQDQQIVPKAIIAPHAGYIYSGSTAAHAYKVIEKAADTIRKIVLLGPSHRVGFKGMAVLSTDIFRTPLGDMPIAKQDRNHIVQLPFVHILDKAHEQEHSLEVQVPFLQEIVSKDTALLPIVIGDATVDQIAAVLELVWGGTDTLVVISSDLSHYHPYNEASAMDKDTSDAIVQMQEQEISADKACGSRGIKGLLHVAQKIGITGHQVALCNSGDTAGDKERVVGYGAYHFGRLAMDDMTISESDGKRLLEVARQSIAYGLQHGKMIGKFSFPREHFVAIPRASFVTLEIDGQLRGCIGSLTASRPLVQDVLQNAYKAAFNDPRFAPLTQEEFNTIEIHISVLSPAVPMQFKSEKSLLNQIEPGKDGLIFAAEGKQGTFLPSVWQSIPDKKEFLARLKQKAGLPADYWSDEVKVYRYRAEMVGK